MWSGARAPVNKCWWAQMYWMQRVRAQIASTTRKGTPQWCGLRAQWLGLWMSDRRSRAALVGNRIAVGYCVAN